MEADKNPFPKLDLFPTATYLGRYIIRTLMCQPEELPNTGGAPYLDEQIYKQETLF